jgi:hypothetical protein
MRIHLFRAAARAVTISSLFSSAPAAAVPGLEMLTSGEGGADFIDGGQGGVEIVGFFPQLAPF